MLGDKWRRSWAIKQCSRFHHATVWCHHRDLASHHECPTLTSRLWIGQVGAVTFRRCLGLAGNEWFVSRPAVLATPLHYNCECNSVWCGLQHVRHFWSEVHCHIKWPDCQQLKQSWFFLTRFMCCSGDTDFNFLHTHKRCFPTLHDMQALSMLAT